MKVTKLRIKNIGLITDETIEINQPLILFYGEIKQGKTTILNCVRWVCGGAFPDDIIQHGAKEGSVDLEFDGGIISRQWYRSKDGKSTKARDVVFVRDGKPVPSPVFEIKRLLNPFLLDQDYLKKMTDLERKRFFAEFFAVDTTDLDKEAVNVDREAVQLRATIKGYGDIELVEVKPVDAAKLKEEFAAIRKQYDDSLKIVWAENKQAQERNDAVEAAESTIRQATGKISNLERQIAEARQEIEKETNWLKANPKLVIKEQPAPPDTSVLEARISDAAAQNVRVEQYKKDKARAAAKANDEKILREKEQRLRDIKKEKIGRLEKITADCKIKGLAFDEQGNFTYEGTDSGMLSTSQLMKLSSELSSLYPEGFGIELLDRGESLGRSIFEFIERAKAEDKSILATIVGEQPAKVPADVGVFVVEKGKVKAAGKVKADQPDLGA